MAVGYSFGGLAALPAERRRRTFLTLGAGLFAAFVLIRLLNVYGDPNPWTRQNTLSKTSMSFLNVTKYPPSLDFLLMTLGPTIFLLGVLDRGLRGVVGRVLIVFGRVPLLFYILQWYFIHGLAVLAAIARGKPVEPLIGHSVIEVPPSDYGFSLFGVYLAWAVVLALSYFPCRAFGA